jgi:hypothetical protein
MESKQMKVSNLIRAAIVGEILPACPEPSANERQAFDAWARAGIVYGETPPASLRDIVQAIETARQVTLAK